MRRPQTRAAAWAAVLCFVIAIPLARGQIDDLTVMQAYDIMEQDRRALEAMRAGGGRHVPSGPDFNQRIEEARKAYWKAYAGGHVPKDVEERFSQLLVDKDLLLVVNRAAYDAGQKAVKDLGVDGPQDRPDLGDIAFKIATEETDHGVRPTASDEFEKWYDAVQKRRTRGNPLVNVMTAVPATAAALVESITKKDPELLAYLAARNDAEKLAALDQLPFESPRDYLLTRMQLEGDERQKAEQWVTQLEKLAGRDSIQQAAEALRDASKDRDGLFKSPILRGPDGDELRLDTAGRAEWAVVHSDPTLYAIWLIREDERVDWPAAKELYQTYWADVFGEQAVIEAAAKVRAAPKTLRHSREALQQEIAGEHRPAAALAKLMPHNPYRDRPLGSLQSGDPQAYVFALLMENRLVEHWDQTPSHYRQLQLDWGEQTLLEITKRLIEAAKDPRGHLTAPKELGVSSADPWQALQELLKQTLSQPDRFFYRLARAASTDEQTKQVDWRFSPSKVEAEYKFLVTSFGRDKVERAVARVREAVEKKADLAKLEGNTSGTSDPLPATYEILWSSASPQQFLQYLLPTRDEAQRYFDRYGRETTLTIVEKLMKAKKQPDSLKRVHLDRSGLSVFDPVSLGLSSPKGSDGGGVGVVSCLTQLLAREQQRLAALPFEIGQHLANTAFGQRSATILRRFETDEGMQYLLNEKGRCYWQPHDAIRKSWKPVSEQPKDAAPAPVVRPLSNPIWGEGREVLAYVDGKHCNGKILFYEGRSQPPTWAVEYETADGSGDTVVQLFSGNQLRERPISADDYPVGSKVRLKYGRRGEIRDGVVRDFDERRGILIEIEPAPQKRGGKIGNASQQWINSRRMIEQYELQLVEAVNASSTKHKTAADKRAP